MSRYADYFAAERRRHIEELLAFLRIPSVSALPQHAADVQQAAEWTAARLDRAGVSGVRVMPTGGHPVVYGEWLQAPGKPTVLVYGHFDTQPADPVELWTTPPFEPAIRDGRVYARGASDNKGNMLVPILAVEAMLRVTGGLPLNVKFFFEGQEEIGSPQLPAFVAEHRDLLAADLVISSDSFLWAPDQPQLLIGLKGLAAIEIEVKGARSDLHSGLFGGAVPNALTSLVEILASMHQRRPGGGAGRVAVEGFYDQVRPLSPEDRRRMAEVPFDEAAYAAELGVDTLVGEPEYTPVERLWARPTLEFNGLWGGFQGAGIKTVLPNEAHAKLTCRLVPDQDPREIVRLLTAHVERHRPPGVKVTVTRPPGNSWPYLMPADHPGNRAAHAVLTRVYGKEPYYARTGGTVPVIPLFLRELGAYTVGFGFASPDENFHAPDEFFRLESLDRGLEAYCAYLDALGETL